MNEPTTVGPLNEVLRRRYGVPGQVGPILTIASDLFPSVDVSDDGIAPELAVYAGVKLCIGGAFDAADAALSSMVQIRNPTGSGVLAVVDRAHVAPGSSGQIQLVFFGTTAADVETQGFLRDTRAVGRAAALTGPRTAAAAGSQIAVYTIASTGQDLLTGFPIVLQPGQGIRFERTTINISLTVTFTWRERRLESWELT